MDHYTDKILILPQILEGVRKSYFYNIVTAKHFNVMFCAFFTI